MGWKSLGASVAGPAHGRLARRNEDAWQVWSDSLGTLAVVADGLGSRPHARAGARALVLAARQAWRHWAPAPVVSPEDYIRLVEVLWRLSLRAISPEDAATTCLMVGIRADGRMLRCQLGDGVIGWEEAEAFCRLGPARADFVTSTLCLGAPHRLLDWSFRLDTEAPDVVLLATDGVADDLQEDRRLGFLRWLRTDVAPLPKAQEKLTQALNDWPVPNHLDDKTLVLLWKM